MLTLLLALFIVMFAMAKVDDRSFRRFVVNLDQFFPVIIAAPQSLVLSSIWAPLAKQGSSAATNASEAQAQEEATRMQLENQQLERSVNNYKRLSRICFRRTKRGQFRSGWSSHHIRQQYPICFW